MLSTTSTTRRAILAASLTLAALLAACQPGPSGPVTPAALTPTPFGAATSTPGGPTAAAPATDLPPRNDAGTAQPDPAEVARQALAAAAGLSGEAISVVSVGAWTDAAIACQLDLPNERLAAQLTGRHTQVLLAVDDKQYEYWVFDDVGGLMLAFGCER